MAHALPNPTPKPGSPSRKQNRKNGKTLSKQKTAKEWPIPKT
jgi:hypothetical protein